MGQAASGLGQTAMQLGTAYGMSDSHALRDMAGKVSEYFNPTTSSMSATGLPPTLNNVPTGATPQFVAPTVGETAGLVNPTIAPAPTATQIMGATENGLGAVPQIAQDTSLIAPTTEALQGASSTLPSMGTALPTLPTVGAGLSAVGDASLMSSAPSAVTESASGLLPLSETGTMGATAAETGSGVASGLGSTIASTVASKVLPYAAIAKVGGHALEAITGQGESNVGSQFARTLENPLEISHWATEFNGGKELTGWTKTFKDILDPIGYITGDK
ncbi:MAG: hypothetical protein WC332_00525 [Clostridia bacterium]